MTINEILQRIEERAEKATPGPFVFSSIKCEAMVRQDVPALVKALRLAIEQRDIATLGYDERYRREVSDKRDAELAAIFES